MNLEEGISDFFWWLYDIQGIWITLKIIKNNFYNPNDIIPNISNDYIKDQLATEIIMKFCKLAEDLGALLMSKDNNKVKFTSNYINYKPYKVKEFFESLNSRLSEDLIRELFNFPPKDFNLNNNNIHKLESSYLFVKSCIDVISRDYLKYRDAYNAYKHGYRIWFKDLGSYPHLEINIENTLEEKKYDRALIYFDSKTLRRELNKIRMILFEDFDLSKMFNVFYEHCLSILKLISVFLYNLWQFYNKDLEEGISLFSDPSFDILTDPNYEYEFFRNLIERELYKFKF